MYEYVWIYMYICKCIHEYMRKVQKDEQKILMVLAGCLDFMEFMFSFIPFHISGVVNKKIIIMKE